MAEAERCLVELTDEVGEPSAEIAARELIANVLVRGSDVRFLLW